MSFQIPWTAYGPSAPGNEPTDGPEQNSKGPEQNSDLCAKPDHIAGGRTWPSLKESKTFDSERLQESPLFERKLF